VSAHQIDGRQIVWLTGLFKQLAGFVAQQIARAKLSPRRQRNDDEQHLFGRQCFSSSVVRLSGQKKMLTQETRASISNSKLRGQIIPPLTNLSSCLRHLQPTR